MEGSPFINKRQLTYLFTEEGENYDIQYNVLDGTTSLYIRIVH